jgi:hypothetical protein
MYKKDDLLLSAVKTKFQENMSTGSILAVGRPTHRHYKIIRLGYKLI